MREEGVVGQIVLHHSSILCSSFPHFINSTYPSLSVLLGPHKWYMVLQCSGSGGPVVRFHGLSVCGGVQMIG